MRKAKQAALKALDLDPMLPEAHASLAFVEVVYGWNWELADRELKRAIELDPGYSTAHYWRAVFVLVGTARLDEALEEAQTALNLDPVTPSINMGLGLVLFHRPNTTRRRNSFTKRWSWSRTSSGPACFSREYIFNSAIPRKPSRLSTSWMYSRRERAFWATPTPSPAALSKPGNFSMTSRNPPGRRTSSLSKSP